MKARIVATLILILATVPRCSATSIGQIRFEVDTVVAQRNSLIDICGISRRDQICNLFHEIDCVTIAEENESSIAVKMLLGIGLPVLYHSVGVARKSLILLEPEATPELFKLIEPLTNKLGIVTPHIFLADDDDFLNAAALAIGSDTAFIVIGKRLIDTMNEAELVSTFAHELGHIKCNHAVKRTVSFVGCTLALGLVAEKALSLGLAHVGRSKLFTGWSRIARHAIIWLASPILTHKLLAPYYRSQEKEADKVEIHLTQNPAALQSSLTKLNYLYHERIQEHIKTRATICKIIDEKLGETCKEQAERLKARLNKTSWFDTMWQTITDVDSHPDNSERGV